MIAGMCRFANGDKYSGQWKSGRRHGIGGYIFAGGDKYQGEWASDQRVGKGMCEYANGDVYQGKALRIRPLSQQYAYLTLQFEESRYNFETFCTVTA